MSSPYFCYSATLFKHKHKQRSVKYDDDSTRVLPSGLWIGVLGTGGI